MSRQLVSIAGASGPVTWPRIVGPNTAGPHWGLARTAMLTAASSAPSGVSANPDARPRRRTWGPAVGDAGSWTPWKPAHRSPARLTCSGSGGPGAEVRPGARGRGAGSAEAADCRDAAGRVATTPNRAGPAGRPPVQASVTAAP